MYTLLLILQSMACSTLSVRYGEMTTIIIDYLLFDIFSWVIGVVCFNIACVSMVTSSSTPFLGSLGQ